MAARSISFRYYAVRNGADVCELAAAGAPRIAMQNSGSIKMTFSGTFLPPPADVNWLSDEIRAEMILDGIPSRLGVFLPTSVTETDDGMSPRVSITAYDRCWRVRDTRAETLIYFPAGMNYINAVVSLLSACGITTISAAPTDAVFPEDREDWEPGTDYLTIINQLLSEISYSDLWFDADGLAILAPKKTPSAVFTDHILNDTDVTSLMIPGISKTTDVYSQPNVFIVICSNADKADGMVAVAENRNAQSPLSIERRGRRISTMRKVDNIASQAELQLYADRLVTESLMTGDVIEVSTCLLPGYGVGDVVALKYGELSALCVESAWTMQLEVGGIMRHTLNRVVINLE